MTLNNPNLDLVAYIILDKTPSILRGNEILTITKGHNGVLYLLKLMRNNPNLDQVNINAYVKFGLIPSILSKATEWNQSLNHGQAQNSIPIPPLPALPSPSPPTPYFGCGEYNKVYSLFLFLFLS